LLGVEREELEGLLIIHERDKHRVKVICLAYKEGAEAIELLHVP